VLTVVLRAAGVPDDADRTRRSDYFELRDEPARGPEPGVTA
jgi:hypothetical protein